MTRIIRRIKRQKVLVESQLVLIILSLLIQMELRISTTKIVGLIKPIPAVCMQPGRKRD